MNFSVSTDHRYPTVVRHQGVPIVLAMDENCHVYYRVLALDPAQPDDDKSWSDRKKLSFPDQIRPAGMSLVTVAMSTVGQTADEPFQAVSDGKHVYLFRQSTDGTLYVDRFVFDPASQTLNPTWEPRFQRNRKRDLPASRKDTLGARDMEGQPFFEPTTELTVVKGLQDGRFCVLLLPGQLPSQWRWQILVTNSEGEIDSFSIRRSEDGLFDMADVQQCCLKWADVERRFQTGPAALLYMQQEEAQDEYGRPQRIKRGARVMLAAPVGSSRYALELDGADDYVSLGDLEGVQINGAITLEAWVKVRATDGRRDIIAHGIDGVSLRIQDGQYQLRAGVHLASYRVPKQDMDHWTHLAGVYDGEQSAWLLYRNGTEVPQEVQESDATGIATVDEEWVIGRCFAGQINNVRIWNRARTTGEIRQVLHRPPVADEPGLVGDWPLNESSGDTVYDRVSENHGQLHVGYLLELDGVDDYVSIPDHDSINFGQDDDFTVTVWLKTALKQKDTAAIDNMIVEKWSGAGGYPYVIRYFNRTYGVDAGKIVVRRYDGTKNPSIVSNSVVNDDRPHHIAFVKNGSKLHLYIDGLLEGTTTDTTTGPTENDSPLFVGVRGDGHYPFSGQVNNLRIWDRGLSSEEILADMGTPAQEVEGVVGNWPLDEGAGNTIHDQTPGKNDGQLHVGYSLVFDGLDDHVALPTMNPDLTNGFTVEAWVRYRGFRRWSRIIDFGNGAPRDNILFANLAFKNDLIFQVYQGSFARTITAPGVLEPDTWMHLAATVDRHGNAALYKNGQQLVTGTIHVPKTVSRVQNYIGRSNWAVDGYFDGDMGEVCVWNVARSQDEIQQDFQDPPACDEPGLIGYWLFDEGAGDEVRDRDSGNHGQLHVGYAQDSHALVFDGIDDYVFVEDFEWPAGGPVTVEFWAKVNGADVRRSSAFTVGAQNNPKRFHVHLPWDDKRLYWDYGDVRSEDWVGRVSVNYSPYLDNWTHVALVSEGNGGKLMAIYLNGQLVNSKPSSDGPDKPLKGLWIGKWDLVGIHKGEITDFRIWSRVRSADEIQADMRRRLDGDEKGLVGYWPLDEGVGNTIHDRTPGEYDGQLYVGPEDNLDEKWGIGPIPADTPDEKWGESSDNPDDKWREGPEDPNDKWVVVPPIAILDFGVSRQGTLALLGDMEDHSEISLTLNGDDDTVLLPIPIVEADATEAPVPMPTIAVDKKGLSVSAGLLNFAHSGDTPYLLDGADGLVHLYFRGDYGQYLVSQHDTLVVRAEYTLLLDGTDDLDDGPRLHFTAHRPGTQMEGYEIAIADGPDEHTCQVTIDNQSGISEVWQNVPRDLVSFLAVLNGTATNDADDPLVQKNELVFYDYGSNVQREGVPDLTAADNPFLGSTLFAVGADNLPDTGKPIMVRNVAAAEITTQSGQDCRWIPEPQGKALQFDRANDYVNLEHPKLAIAGDLAVEAWVNVKKGAGSSNPLDPLRIVNYRSAGLRFALGLIKEKEGNDYKVFAASEDKTAQTADTQVSPEEWTHLAAVYNATNALKLDGQGYVDCGNDVTLDMTQAVTVEAWVTPETESGQRLQPEVVLSKWGALEGDQSWRLYIDSDDRPCFETRDQHRRRISVKANLPLATGQSYHLAGALDASPKEEVALAFDGTDDHIALKEMKTDFTNGFTVTAWVRYHNFKDWSMIIDFGNGKANNNITFGNWEEKNDLVLGVWGEGEKTSTGIRAIGKLELNTWMHLAATVDRDGNAALYKNGRQLATGRVRVPAHVSREDNYIGKNNRPGLPLFDGDLREVRIWKRALSIVEIGEDMDKPALEVLDAAGHWAFDELDKQFAVKGEVQDRSGHWEEGTLEGGLTKDSFKDVDKCRYEQKLWVNGILQSWRLVTVDDEKTSGQLADRLKSSDTMMKLDREVDVGECLLLQDEQIVVGQVSKRQVDNETIYDLVVDRAVNGITREHRHNAEVHFLKRAANEVAHTTAKVNLGRSASDEGYFQGIIDDVRIWDVGRRDWQIQYYQDHPLPRDAEDLASDWRFEESRGKTAFDTRGSNHGRLIHPEAEEIEHMWAPSTRDARLTLYVNGRAVQTSVQELGPDKYGGYGTPGQFTIGAMLGKVPADDIGARFRATYAYARDHGFVAGFPNFHMETYEGVTVYGTILLGQGAAEWRDVPASELGISPTDDIGARFRATYAYARDHGFVAGFPNFHMETYEGVTVYGTILLGQGAAEWRDVPASELGISPTDDIGARFRATYAYARDHGFVAGFPNFHMETYEGVTVYGTILLGQGAAEWRDVPAGTPQQCMSGHIDEVRVWSEVRNSEQVRDNMYRALSGAEEGLAGYWPLDEGEGADILDQTGNGQKGELKGPQWIDSTAPIGNEGPEVRNIYGGQAKQGFSKQITGPPAAVEYGDMQWDDEGNLFGVMKRCYIFRDDALQLVTGFKVGDLELNYIGQVQTAPTLIGYIEGAPPVPGENLSVNDPVTDDYVGTSAIELTEAKETTQVYSASRDTGFDMSVDLKAGVHWAVGAEAGMFVETTVFESEGKVGLHAYFEHSLGYLSSASKTAGTSKTLTKSLTLGGSWEEEHDYDQDGQLRYLNPDVGRRYLPNNMGYALVKSGTADLFALRLRRTGSLVAFQVLPNPDIPEDWNIIMFPLNPKYIKNGTLDGMVGLIADPDYPGAILGERGSYFKPLEAYALKERIEREASKIEGYYANFAADAKIGTGVDGPSSELPGAELGYDWETGRDKRSMVNTYVWTADGGFYAEEEQFSSIRQESLGGSYHFLGQRGVYADVKLAAGLGFFFEVDALFGGHINTTVSKSEEEKAAFGLHVDLQGEGFLNRWQGDPDKQQGFYTAEPCPGKVDAYRFMTFYLAPKPQNFDHFFEKIVDPEWLQGQGKYAGEYGPNARALREARFRPNEVWRVLHRVTYVSRIPPKFDPTPVEAVAKDVRRPANIEANIGLIREIERIKRRMSPIPDESHLMILGRAIDRLLFGDVSENGQHPSELEKFASWWSERGEDVKRGIRQDMMTYLKAFYESDLTPPEIEGDKQRVTENLQVLYTFKEGKGETIHDVSNIGKPLHLSIEDTGAVSWLPCGLAITGETLMATPKPATKLIEAAKASNEITIEVWCKPANEIQGGPARIVTLSIDPYNRNFTLGQDSEHFQIRLRTTQTNDNGSDKALEAGDVATGGLSHLVYTRDASGIAMFYVNGVQASDHIDHEVPGKFSNWNDGYQFGLGNEFTRNRPWQGALNLVAVYNRALSLAEIKQNYNTGVSTTN